MEAKKKLCSDGYMAAKTRGDTCSMSNSEQAVQLGKRKIKQIRSSSFDAVPRNDIVLKLYYVIHKNRPFNFF